ncbi:MAG TPA: ogr/Delta-like zinc finger family protein [Anaerohalosphaeraceae bacterium]|nr:ogr/Delta-like zinc finger family protein [Anaerohalosphaeraceae bacterium]
MTETSTTKTKGIACPKCGCKDWKVTDTRVFSHNKIRRYRQCRNCGRKIRTVEKIEVITE